MSEKSLIEKILARKARINSIRFRMKTLEENDWAKLGEASVEISKLPIIIKTKARNLQQIESEARKMKNKDNLGLLIIDYLQLIRNRGKFNNREQEVSDISRSLKLLAMDLEIPIIGLCQLNREASLQREPSLANLRESGAIEQDADNVWFLYQEEESESRFADVKLKIAKQRNGELGKIDLKFNKPISEFRGVTKYY